jgi:hypothetical protein
VIYFEGYPGEIQSLRWSNVLHFLMKYIVHSFPLHNMILEALKGPLTDSVSTYRVVPFTCKKIMKVLLIT